VSHKALMLFLLLASLQTTIQQGFLLLLKTNYGLLEWLFQKADFSYKGCSFDYVRISKGIK